MDDQSPSPAAAESAAERRAKRRAASAAVRLPPIAPGGGTPAADDDAAPAADGAKKGRGRKQRSTAAEVDPEAEEVARMAAAPLSDVQPLALSCPAGYSYQYCPAGGGEGSLRVGTSES